MAQVDVQEVNVVRRAEQIAGIRRALVAALPHRWPAMMRAWAEGTGDCFWLMYAANYLARTGGTRWAIDPIRPPSRLREAPPVDLAPLARLDVVLLTHAHEDHLDPELWRSLAGSGAQWVVPEGMVERFCFETGLPASRLIIARPRQTLHLGHLRITPFDGMHWEKIAGVSGRGRGIDATGYLIAFGDQRWLFPGDTRTYDAAWLPDFGPVDVLFAHVWLGRGAACEAVPPLSDAFCHFVRDLQPRRSVVLTHLYEVARPATDCWRRSHARWIARELKAADASLTVQVPAFWEAVTP